MRLRSAPVACAAALAVSACSLMPGPTSAPDACGFPPDAALVFAGRSTTAALEVQEVVGDPMSNDPADIYITREELDQGDLHGRLVCAVYVDPPGFVEVTVAPDGWDPETGRPSTSARASEGPTETAPVSTPDRLLTREEALAAVHETAPGTEGWEVLVTTVGTVRDVNPNWNLSDWSRDLPEDTWIWHVALRSGDEAVFVFLDAVEGTIYEVAAGIVN